MLNIIKGRIARPQKVCIYGSEGIGKSTLASKFPEPLFLDTEGGTSHLDVSRLPCPADWEGLIRDIHDIAGTPGCCRTMVLDTADWAEQLAVQYVLRQYKQTSIEAFGYGKGYTYLSETFASLLKVCDDVIDAGMNVVITAHAKMRKMELPDEQGAFDRWELKLSKNVAPLLKEWCDMLLFCNYKTFVVTTENRTGKASGGKRVMYAAHHPCWDAKNRHGLPDEMDMDYRYLAPIFAGTRTENAPSSPETKEPAAGTGSGAPAVPDPDRTTPSSNEPARPAPKPQTLEPVRPDTLKQLEKWMDGAGIKEEELTDLVAQKGYYPNKKISQYPERFVREWIMPHWSQIVTTVCANPEHVPF